MAYTKIEALKNKETLINKSIAIYPSQANKFSSFKKDRHETWSEFIEYVNNLLEKDKKGEK